MRSDNVEFTSINGTPARKPRFVLRLNFGDDATPDYVYFTDTTGIPNIPVDGVIYESLIETFTTTSQELKLDTGINTVGGMSFSLLDKNNAITDLLSAKLISKKGIRKKEVKFFFGFKDLDFSKFVEIQTQNIDRDLIIKGKVYTFNCSDKQRNLTKKIFDRITTNLYQEMNSTQLFCYVYDATKFQYNDHGNSYSDAPNQKVFYIKINNEIMRITGWVSDNSFGIPLYKLTIGKRHVLNSVQSSHAVTISDDAENKPEVDQVIYIEEPSFSILYSVITGARYNKPTKVWPANWTASIGENSIVISDFINIGKDFWDLTDENAGKIQKFIGEDIQTAKDFIEGQLLRLYSTFLPVRGSGKLGLARASNVLTDAPYTLVFDESNIVKITNFSYRLNEVVNLIKINWGYDFIDGLYQKTPVYFDQESYNINQYANLKTFNFRGLSTERHTITDIKYVFDMVRDRTSAPPICLTLHVLPSNNMVEVGDTHRVRIKNFPDHTGRLKTLDRTMEVQSLSVDWITGQLILKMFGTTQKAQPITFAGGENYLPDSYFDSAINGGTDLSTIAGANVIGGVLHLTQNAILTGSNNSNSAAAVYSYLGKVTIDSGVTITTTKNVDIRVSDEFRGADGGVLTSKGQGYAGQSGVGATVAAVEAADIAQGYLGSTEGMGGASNNTFEEGSGMVSRGRAKGSLTAIRGVRVQGAKSEIPLLNLNLSGSFLAGVPDDMQGVKGAGGAGFYQPALSSSTDSAAAFTLNGSAGGNSGGAIRITARGCVFEPLFLCDVSGNNGVLGLRQTVGVGTYALNDVTIEVNAGSGAGGGSGTLLILIDGATTPPTVTDNNFIAKNGITFPPVGEVTYLKTNEYKSPFSSNIIAAYSTITPDLGIQKDQHDSAFRVQYLNTLEVPKGITPKRALTPASVTVTEKNNTPASALGNISTINLSFSKASNDNGFAYANVYYRVQNSSQWVLGGASKTSVDIVLTSDGSIYDFEIRSVSKQGIETNGGLFATYTVSNVKTSIDSTVLGVPAISGLEIQGMGNETVFSGKDCVFEWRKSALQSWYNLGYEPLAQGAGAGDLELYFKDYIVEIYSTVTGKLLRTDNVMENRYVYTYEKNAMDNNGIAQRKVKIKVHQRSKLNVIGTAATLEVENKAPELSTGVSLTARWSMILFSHTLPIDVDYSHTNIYLSETTGFIVNEETLIFSGSDSTLSISENIKTNTDYFLRYENHDVFGHGILSGELKVTTLKIIGDEIENVHPETLIDGDLTATVNLKAGGIVIVGDETLPHVRIGAEYDSGASKTYLQRFISGAQTLFSFDESGEAIFYGDVKLDVQDSAISAGQTAFNTGVGFWLGTVNSAPEFSIGDGAENSLTYSLSGGLNIGRDTVFKGVDAFNVDTMYYSTRFESYSPFNITTGANSTVSRTNYAPVTFKILNNTSALLSESCSIAKIRTQDINDMPVFERELRIKLKVYQRTFPSTATVKFRFNGGSSGASVDFIELIQSSGSNLKLTVRPMTGAYISNVDIGASLGGRFGWDFIDNLTININENKTVSVILNGTTVYTSTTVFTFYQGISIPYDPVIITLSVSNLAISSPSNICEVDLYELKMQQLG